MVEKQKILTVILETPNQICNLSRGSFHIITLCFLGSNTVLYRKTGCQQCTRHVPTNFHSEEFWLLRRLMPVQIVCQPICEKQKKIACMTAGRVALAWLAWARRDCSSNHATCKWIPRDRYFKYTIKAVAVYITLYNLINLPKIKHQTGGYTQGQQTIKQGMSNHPLASELFINLIHKHGAYKYRTNGLFPTHYEGVFFF